MPIVNINGVTAYRSEPATPRRGALILIHEIWGLVDHIKQVADRFAAEGYLVIAPDLLTDAGISPEVGDELQAIMREPDEAKRTAAQPYLREKLAAPREPGFAEEAVAKLKRIVDDLAIEPGVEGRIAVLGFCFGGTYSFALAAADDRVKASVPFYGSAPDAEHIATIHCPVLALYGENDERLITALPEVRTQMADARIDFTDHVYSGAGHAFFNDSNVHAYEPTAAADAWRRANEFLTAHL
jgi:carboxymethylenebutenolidase